MHRRIESEFFAARDVVSDINEHMQTLCSLAEKCNHVVEGGVRWVVSTWAFIYGCACRGGTVESYCLYTTPEIERALGICKEENVTWIFHEGDWLQCEIPETDLLFIDTRHCYVQIKEELRKHGPKARKYIVLHDTITYGQFGEDNMAPGLWQAVEELLDEDVWHILHHYKHNNGLVVLER